MEVEKYFTDEPPSVRSMMVPFRGKERPVQIYDFIGSDGHYSGSFGSQWAKYRNTQIDRLNGTQTSYKHLLAFVQEDISVLRQAVCLEVGSGAGRFTDYLVDLCKTVITVEPSPAIFVNAALGADNLIPCRADLFRIPVQRDDVDVVFCRGVIQHTPSPRRAIERLFDYAKRGGTVLFDVYPLRWYTPLVAKYWLRPLTRRLNQERFMVWVDNYLPGLLRFKRDVVNRVLPKNTTGINIANQILPIADFTRATELGSWEQQVEWSKLDTIDMYTPRYDRPMTFGAIIRTLKRLGARDIQANPSTFCFKAGVP